jgi:3-methyl-2-oxobutanoate hydroxymethyltransferase
VLEVVPSDLAAKITSELTIPTIGIGAGSGCDAQVLVWQDMAGLRTGGAAARFVKQYAAVGDILEEAAGRFAREVRDGVYPDAEHSYS